MRVGKGGEMFTSSFANESLKCFSPFQLFDGWATPLARPPRVPFW